MFDVVFVEKFVGNFFLVALVLIFFSHFTALRCRKYVTRFVARCCYCRDPFFNRFLNDNKQIKDGTSPHVGDGTFLDGVYLTIFVQYSVVGWAGVSALLCCRGRVLECSPVLTPRERNTKNVKLSCAAAVVLVTSAGVRGWTCIYIP